MKKETEIVTNKPNQSREAEEPRLPKARGIVLGKLQARGDFHRMAERQAKIRVSSAEVYDVIDQIFYYIDLFNNTGEYDTRVLDHDFEDIMVINEFAPFIIPSKVKLDALDVIHNDLLVRSEQTRVDIASYGDFCELQARFRSFFKKDLSEQTGTLDQLKAAQNLMNVLDRLTIPGPAHQGYITRYIGAPFIPLALNQGLEVFYKTDMYFNSDIGTVLADYCSQLRF